MVAPKRHPVTPESAAQARNEAKRELERSHCNTPSDWGSGGYFYPICPPKTARRCDLCGEPLPRPHEPGKHRQSDVVVMWPATDEEFAQGVHGAKHYIHSEDCLRL